MNIHISATITSKYHPMTIIFCSWIKDETKNTQMVLSRVFSQSLHNIKWNMTKQKSPVMLIPEEGCIGRKFEIEVAKLFM
jgi:hypothetical protein